MLLKEIVNILDSKVLTQGLDLDKEVSYAFSSDLMSDVLTRDYEDTILITGLANLQAIRTAEMSDIAYVIIGRNKEVGQDMVDLAAESGIVLIHSEFSLFKISGLLYGAGIKPIF